ncbi:Aste57867_22950 [Aphanomyces stellatus]|uniref:Aste57867_22950 protein n=1 Tax=Aphanomyces stellatus TaxID=120398 RepID=A0A485LLJ9_9STRA|nr:hypothetical protein As57867_022879 [Aphanomyces stellatus]VFT99600.1 Aste57867_22950 [Aphanomyces stellatus]
MDDDAAALSFVKEGCACNRPVFDLKYLRTHRAGSVKLIRCFPHCCPSHSYANFCTSSIGVKMRGDVCESDRAYLRFQPTTEHVYQVGEEIDATVVLDDVRTADNQKGEWIPSESANVDPTTPRDLVFRFNHVNSVGWHYGWMGTSTKAHRTCTHHLVAYVLRRIVRDSRVFCQVRAVLPSPPFIVMSYRRACYKCQKHRDSDDHALCECEGEFNVSHGQLSVPSPSSSPDRMAPPPPPPSSSAALVASIERDLMSIFHFLNAMPAALFADHFVRLEAHLVNGVLGPSDERAPTQPLLTQLLRPAYQRPPLSPDMHALLASAMDCMLHALAFIPQNRENFRHYAAFLFDRKALGESYVHWLQSYYDLLNSRVDVTAVAKQARQTSRQIDSMRPSCFEYYVAQLREVYLGTKNPSPPLRQSSPSALRGRWTYQHTAALALATDPSLLAVLRWISMLYAFELDFDGTTLQMRSDLQLYHTIASEFVLDGTPRIFRAFPNGESTMANLSGFLHGDYIGCATGNQDDVELHLFSWPLDAAMSFVTRCRLKTHPGQGLSVEAQVCQSPVETPMDWSTMTADERCKQYVREMEEVVLQCSVFYRPAPKK